jgi:hypothetical protein
MICLPSLFYVAISLVSLYIQYSFTTVVTTGMLFHFVFIVLWAIFLYLLCMINWSSVAWVLVVTPFVVGYFILKLFLEAAISDPSILLPYGTPVPYTSPTKSK